MVQDAIDSVISYIELPVHFLLCVCDEDKAAVIFVICRKKLDFLGHLNFDILNIGVCIHRRTFARIAVIRE
jgi:hypothetical protein